MARLLALYLFSATYYLTIVTAAYNGTTAACQQLKSSWSNVTFSANQSQYTALSTENWYFSFALHKKIDSGLRCSGLTQLGNILHV